jgi:predicted PurR-regulated permease PerM
MRKQADVPPLLAMVVLLAGVGVGGVLGALIAIPLARALRVIVVRAVAPAVRAWTGAEQTGAG